MGYHEILYRGEIPRSTETQPRNPTPKPNPVNPETPTDWMVWTLGVCSVLFCPKPAKARPVILIKATAFANPTGNWELVSEKG